MDARSIAVDPEIVRIVQRAVPGARVHGAVVMGADEGVETKHVTAKAVGYGLVLRIDAVVDGASKSFVLHGAGANQFGHDRRADRAAELLLAADSFALVPRHTRALDVGTFCQEGGAISLKGSGEFYLLTEYAAGRPYAEDLRRIAATSNAQAHDYERATSLARYLASLHTERHDNPQVYARSLRDLLGNGEGIFGIVDGYPAAGGGVDMVQLERLERSCLAWRWKLKGAAPRLSRIHGDFHPFNVLFDDRSELHLLDTSRGSLGDPADDVACMAINYVFFALEASARWSDAFARLWYQFWEQYLAASGDSKLLDVVSPFLTWRALVLACPTWYPGLDEAARAKLLAFAENAMASERFDPTSAEAVFR